MAMLVLLTVVSTKLGYAELNVASVEGTLLPEECSAESCGVAQDDLHDPEASIQSGCPPCSIRNREPCAKGARKCGACLAGFVAHDGSNGTLPGNAPCSKVDLGVDTIFLDVPVVNLDALSGAQGELTRQEAFESLRRGVADVGFMQLSHHGVDLELINAALEASKKYFAQSEETKLEQVYPYRHADNTGYLQKGGENLDDDEGRGDPKETLDLNRDLIVTNPYLKETPLPMYWEALNTVKNKLLTAWEEMLGADAGFLTAQHSGGRNNLRLLHYFPVPTADEQPRCQAHTDYGVMTLLVADSEGLEVFNRKTGTFQRMALATDRIIVNVGDLMHRWSNGRFASTLHRVVSAQSSEPSSRYSMAYFVHPNKDSMIDPRDLLVDPSTSAQFAPVNAVAYLQERLQATIE